MNSAAVCPPRRRMRSTVQQNTCPAVLAASVSVEGEGTQELDASVR